MSGSWIAGQNSFRPCEEPQVSCHRVGVHGAIRPVALVAGDCWNAPILIVGGEDCPSQLHRICGNKLVGADLWP